MTTTMDTSGPARLGTAQCGDRDAFEAPVGPGRAERHANCYRMLASIHDPDDAIQEATLRAWREGDGPAHVAVSRRIAAPAKEIFSILAAPANHPRLDGSGMLKTASTPSALRAVGDTFTVSMYLESIGPYQMLNRVIAFEPEHCLAWEPTPGDAAAAKAAGLPVGASQGYYWGFELVANDEQTIVTEHFDCTAAADEIKLAVENGRAWTMAMTATLERLAAWVEQPSGP